MNYSQKEVQQWHKYPIEDTIKMIAEKDNLSLSKAKQLFLESKTYQIIQNVGEEFYEDEPQQFCELWKK